jgi:hypothetical protein
MSVNLMQYFKIVIKVVLVVLVLMAILLGSFGASLYIDMKPQIPQYNYWLWKQSQKNSVNFEAYGSKAWDRVCFLGPYNEFSSELTGLSWDISEYTDVLSSDGHTVVVFINDTEVTDFIVQIRSKGDFSSLSGTCLSRSKSFIKKNKDSNIYTPLT